MTASPDSLQLRYAAIEGYYNDRRWDEVASLSEALLDELPDQPGHPLRQRLQLLLGHTYCYGYQDAATATGFYSRVLAASEEATLRKIAEQGLSQCIDLADTTKPATPWMEQRTAVEVIDEPELIALAQADPKTAATVELTPLPNQRPLPSQQNLPSSQPSPAEIAELSKGLLRVAIG